MKATKDKILDAAEELFAERGYASTSLRDITALAGANLASVNYHFGSKLSLLSAVLQRRFDPVNRERLERLTSLEHEAGSQPVDLREVLRAFFAPVLDRLREPGSGWLQFMRLVGRTHSDTSEEIRACFIGQVQEVATRFLAAFGRALPDLPADVLGLRVHFVVGAMAHTFAFCQHEDMPFMDAVPHPDRLLENLVDFSAEGLRAPVRSAMTKT